MTRPARIFCFGIAVLDRVYELETLPQGDGKITALGYRESGGGIAGTAAVAIAALGGASAYAGALGDDAAGCWLRAQMDALGVGLAHAACRAGARTPTSCALVDAAGERCLIVDRGTATPPVPPLSALIGADAILIDHRFPAEAAAMLSNAPAALPRVLDGEGGTKADLRHLASLVQYPIFSRNGLHAATGETDPARGLAQIHAPIARAIGVTLGEHGSLWRTDAQAMLHFGAPSVQARDTTGCGDVFHGAFTLAIAEGRLLPDAIRFATAAAALKAENGAGWRGMPTRARTEALAEQVLQRPI